MLPELSLVSVFLAGLLGGVHCAAMCGGIVAVTGAGRSRAELLAYNLGRIGSYVVAGAMAGLVGSTGQWIALMLPVQQLAFVLMNLVLIAIGLQLAGVLNSMAVLEAPGRWVWPKVQPLAGRLLHSRGFAGALATGAAWGWVPCGMVYGVLAAALVSGSPATGASLLLAFGLGTLPNLLALGALSGATRRWSAHRGLRAAAGLLVITFGLAGLARIDPLAHLRPVLDLCVTWLRA